MEFIDVYSSIYHTKIITALYPGMKKIHECVLRVSYALHRAPDHDLSSLSF